MFASHRREHAEMPTLPKRKRIDVRRYLTSAEIECNETNYVRHNGALASLVSLKTLPNGFVTADTMRYLTATRNLRFPHEIVVDLTTVEKTKAKKDLQKRLTDKVAGDEFDRLRRSRQKRKCKSAVGDGLDSRSDKARDDKSVFSRLVPSLVRNKVERLFALLLNPLSLGKMSSRKLFLKEKPKPRKLSRSGIESFSSV